MRRSATPSSATAASTSRASCRASRPARATCASTWSSARRLSSWLPRQTKRPHVVVGHVVGDLGAAFLARGELEVEMDAAEDAAACLLLRQLREARVLARD